MTLLPSKDPTFNNISLGVSFQYVNSHGWGGGHRHSDHSTLLVCFHVRIQRLNIYVTATLMLSSPNPLYYICVYFAYMCVYFFFLINKLYFRSVLLT
jgi:hypothetical protein